MSTSIVSVQPRFPQSPPSLGRCSGGCLPPICEGLACQLASQVPLQGVVPKPFRVLIAENLGTEGTESLRNFESICPEVVFNFLAKQPNSEELTKVVLQALQETLYDLLVVRGNCQVSKEFVKQIPEDKKPTYVLRAGTGLDNLSTDALRDAGIDFGNTPWVNTQATAELTIGLMLGVAREISSADRQVKGGVWDRTRLTGMELSGKTLGIVGMGEIGKAVAKIAHAFGMKVVGLTPRNGKPNETPYYLAGYATLNDLCRMAHVLTVHVPLNESTEGLIGKEQLDLLVGDGSKNPILLNLARGGIVNEKALLDALQNHQLYGAGIDVFAEDPAPPDSISAQLASHSLVVAMPHLGGQTREASQKMALAVINKVKEMNVAKSVANSLSTQTNH